MRALLENLWTNVRPEHRPAVAAQLTALDEALGRLIGEPLARHFAAHADLQGIGGADGDRA
jgi:hypothetical protein